MSNITFVLNNLFKHLNFYVTYSHYFILHFINQRYRTFITTFYMSNQFLYSNIYESSKQNPKATIFKSNSHLYLE